MIHASLVALLSKKWYANKRDFALSERSRFIHESLAEERLHDAREPQHESHKTSANTRYLCSHVPTVMPTEIADVAKQWPAGGWRGPWARCNSEPLTVQKKRE